MVWCGPLHLRAFPHGGHRKFNNFLQRGTLLLKSLLFLVSLLKLWNFRALVPGSFELHLLCHVTLLYCQVDPKPKPKAKSKAKKSLLPLLILPLMWQPLAHLNQCYSSNSLPFLPRGFSLPGRHGICMHQHSTSGIRKRISKKKRRRMWHSTYRHMMQCEDVGWLLRWFAVMTNFVI